MTIQFGDNDTKQTFSESLRYRLGIYHGIDAIDEYLERFFANECSSEFKENEEIYQEIKDLVIKYRNTASLIIMVNSTKEFYYRVYNENFDLVLRKNIKYI